MADHRLLGSRSVWLLAMVVGGTAIFVAGCGDSDGAGSTSTTATRTTSTSTSAETSTTTTSTTTSTADAETATVEVFFTVGDGSECGEVEGFDRDVPGDADPVLAAFTQLVAGPTADEAAAGAGSFFSADTATVVKSVRLDDGLLAADFSDLRPLIPNASTSCGSEALLAQLNGTAFQFDGVERARYQLEGSCEDFGNWLQRECVEFDRDGQRPVETNERASGSGCTPPVGDDLPDGVWFGFVADHDTRQVSVDLACWFTGAAAGDAAAEDGEESPPPNDYYIRNQSDQIRVLAVASAANVAWLPDPGNPESVETVSYDVWLAAQPNRAFRPGVWLSVEDGQVTSIEEQYVP